MDIKEWFETSGSYRDGLELYRNLPNCSSNLLRSLERESKSNLLKLKYELKKALESGNRVVVSEIKESPAQPKKMPEKPKFDDNIIEQSAKVTFTKETLAMYPPELHDTYRDRINCFYKACSLKIILNGLDDDAEEEAFSIQLQIEELWDRIDSCWTILNHWKQHKRIMPVKTTVDFNTLNAIQLVKRRDQIQTSISKRLPTINKLEMEVEASPEDKTKLNRLNKKREELQQLLIDLDVIRKILRKEEG
ncbi:hypothetical protein [Flavobacterium beibuense]|uniref:hypothetical protein n=1 Tax=Flavobacterium beibuense TaxID=657326 RepID=UPI003A93BD46